MSTHSALDIIDAQPNPWDKADGILRQGGFDYLVEWSNFTDAANILAGLVMDSPAATRAYSDTEKAEVYIKIAEAYLQSDVSAKCCSHKEEEHHFKHWCITDSDQYIDFVMYVLVVCCGKCI